MDVGCPYLISNDADVSKSTAKQNATPLSWLSFGSPKEKRKKGTGVDRLLRNAISPFF